MTKLFPREVLKNIQHYTQINDHTTAALTLAAFMRDVNAERKLCVLIAKQERQGCLFAPQIDERRDILNKVLTKVRRQYPIEEYKAVYQSF